MKVILRVESGADTGRELRLKVNQVGRVGTSDAADLVVKNDASLDTLHFELATDANGCQLRRLSGKYVLLDGQEVKETASLRDDCYVVAGSSLFHVRMIVRPPIAAAAATVAVAPLAGTAMSASASPKIAPNPATAPNSKVATLRKSLLAAGEPLLAMLDAACDPQILDLLARGGEMYESLYDGQKGEELADVAPYLVELRPDAALLDQIIEKGWGKSWGIYLTATIDFDEVRKHFRHFLLAQTATGQQVCFRFYDPRVLRKLLPACTAAETTELFGPVSALFMEDERPTTLLRFTCGSSGLSTATMPVSQGPGR